MRRLIIVFFLTLSVVPAHAVSPVRVEWETAEDFAEGEPVSTEIVEPGVLRPGLAFEKWVDFQDKRLWDWARNPKTGEIILGTGSDGEVWTVDSQGERRLLAKLEEADVYAVAVSADGEVFSAGSPGGKIYRIDENGNAEVFFETGEEFVWDLKTDEDGVLWAATGTQGRIYRIQTKDEGEVYFDSDEASILCLGRDAQGALLAGSSPHGFVYRITGKDEGAVILDSGKDEVRAMVVSPEGDIYAAANGGGKKTSSKNASQSAGEIVGRLIVSSVLLQKNGEDEGGEEGDAEKEEEKKETKIKVSSKGGKGSVFRIHKNFYPEELWAGDDVVHCLLWHEGRLWIGTGDEGYVFTLDVSGNWGQAGKVEDEQITGLWTDSNGRFYSATSNLGRVWRRQSQTTQPSIYHSEPVDSELFAQWGKLHVYGEGRWSLRSRSGNTPQPDKSWYPWKPVAEETVASPPARYLQFEIQLESGAIERVVLFYQPQNQPPVVEEIRVLPQGTGFVMQEKLSSVTRSYSARELLVRDLEPREPRTRYSPEIQPGLRTFVWNADDPNGDELRYQFEIRLETETGWRVLEKDMEEEVLTLDTTGWPEGVYYARVSAVDETSNPPGTGLSGTLVSPAWTVDHTPPVIELVSKEKDSARIRVRDGVSLLAKVEVSETGREYRFVAPVDGILDGLAEEFEISLPEDKPLFIRAQDEAGNIAGFQVQ